MQLVVTAPASELGRALSRAVKAAPPAPAEDPRKVVINLLAQPPNNLLHDGHRWLRYSPARIVRETRQMLVDRRHRDCDLVVHASYAFLRAVEAGAAPGRKLIPIVEAALEAEDLVLADPRPSCVIRVGYQYGPGSADLKLYRLAFRIGRPYWAGPRKALHDHVHHVDAAGALLLAARRPPAARIAYATDGKPASFQSFMDHFARRVGNPLPLHIPRISRLPAQLVVAQEHMQMCELGVAGPAQPRVAGFEPRFRGYRSGIDDVIRSW